MNAMVTNLTDGVVTLRALEPTDVDTLYLWENMPELWQYGDRRAPMSRHQLWEYATTYDADPLRAGQLRLMITLADTGESVGAVDIFDLDAHDLRAAVGVLVAPDYQRRGYGSRALRLLAAYAAATLGLVQLWCITAEANKASRAAFASAGFTQSGRLNSWLRTGRATMSDALLLQLIL